MNTFDVMNPCFATEQNMGRVRFSKTWAMPNHNTFSIKPIKEFVARWTLGADIIVDPFARDSRVGTITNDLNPETDAQYHMKAEAFLNCLLTQGVEATSDQIVNNTAIGFRAHAGGTGDELSETLTTANIFKKIELLIKKQNKAMRKRGGRKLPAKTISKI